MPMDCIFCKIAHGKLNATIVYEDDQILAFRDLNPQAPTHILVIPKKHIATLNDVTETDSILLGNMILAAKKIAKMEQLSEAGYRLLFNVNQQGGQTVYHIHLHVVGGRTMTWPPG
jgi:histidine triad (HIT) family protein